MLDYFAFKDEHAEYNNVSEADFDLDWINSIVDEYLMEDPKTTPQSTPFSVQIPHFIGTNWHSTKSKIIALLATRTGSRGIPLTYLTKITRLVWEDTDNMPNLADRRTATKMHEGNTYELDNREFFRILLSIFTSTTLDNVVNDYADLNNGMGAWVAILANVEGSNYVDELKSMGKEVITGAFFDPTKNFTIETYFDKYVESHVLHKEAGDPVPHWRKIKQFMAGIRCVELQNNFRHLKDDPVYGTFTSLYHKINENYRLLIKQGIIKPGSVFKRRIAQLDADPFNTA